MQDLGIDDIAVVGVAKGPERDAGMERFFMPDRPPFRSSRAIRCSTICSACGMKRTALPSARTGPGARPPSTSNPLDEIAGIGPTRKRALLLHFGSAKAVKRAGLADLEATPGISAQLARQIYESFPRKRLMHSCRNLAPNWENHTVFTKMRLDPPPPPCPTKMP
jgi:excinuclease ABC subunit C